MPRDEAAEMKRPGEESSSSPRLDLRELALPWVLFSMIDEHVPGKASAVGRGVVDVF
jgi:hypothetical protein